MCAAVYNAAMGIDVYSLTMKRFFLIFLLVLLPLQLSWAAAASYCQHEETKSTQHFGHHAHKHQSSFDTLDDKSNPTKVHTDCGSCHLSGMSSILAQSMLIAFSEDAIYIEFLPSVYTSHIPDNPERPKLHLAS